MAKFSHLYSTTSGHVPASLARGQLSTNIPDKLVYTSTPDGQVTVISNGNTGMSNPGGALGVHIPVQFHPVAQLATGYTETTLGAKFVDNGTTAVLQSIPVFMFGQLWYVPALSSASINTGCYQLSGNINSRTVSLAGVGAPLPTTSGTLNYGTGDFTLIIKSDGHLYPWFYLPFYRGTANSQIVGLARISPYQTFGAIPVSAGFPGAAASSYWGT